MNSILSRLNDLEGKIGKKLTAKVLYIDKTAEVLSGQDIIKALHNYRNISSIEFINIPSGSGLIPELIVGLVEDGRSVEVKS